MVATIGCVCVATKDTESISEDGVGVLRTMRLLVVLMPSATMAFSAGCARTQTKAVDEMYDFFMSADLSDMPGDI
jgi:hypothetical protein